MCVANRTLLLDMIADIGTNRFGYIYDFGDHWSHTIKMVKPMPAVPGIAYPLLIDAVGRCPPKDSGGHPPKTRRQVSMLLFLAPTAMDPVDRNRDQVAGDDQVLSASGNVAYGSQARVRRPAKHVSSTSDS